jgi:CRISPR-associated protein Csb2
MFAIGIRYLNGFAVASEPDHRDRPEWPPHPGRVFMALAAAHFQTGQEPKERAALEWLENQPAPEILAPGHEVRNVVTHYVPVSDKAGDAQKPPTAIIPSAPALARDRQPRTFAHVWLEEEAVYLCWREAECSEDHRTALDALCRKVTRIGHSISLVQMWVCDQSEAIAPNWLPEEDQAEIRLRVPGAGTLEELERRFNSEDCELYGQLCVEAEDETKTKAERKSASKTLKDRFGNESPPRLRPVLPLYHGYARPTTVGKELAIPSSIFSPHLFVWTLARIDGPYGELDLACTLAVTDDGARRFERMPKMPAPKY